MCKCANVQMLGKCANVRMCKCANCRLCTTESFCPHSHINNFIHQRSNKMRTFAHLHIRTFPLICTLTISSTNAATKCDHLHICTFAHLHIPPHLHICTFAHLHIPPLLHICTFAHLHISPHLHICTFAHLHIPLGKPPYEACPLLRVSA